MLETSFVGDWRIVVTQHDASWSQRVIVKNTAAGQQVLAGTVGLHLNVQGNGTSPWQLTIEHNDGSGWTSNDLRVDPRQISGASITQMVRSDDSPTTGDRDYNDLVVRVEKLGMVDQPSAPFAVWPATMQVMPEGIFETALGQYFLAVTIRNIWTEPWPAQAAVGLTTRCRSWLEAGGVVVDDMWTANDQAAVGQEVVGGRVLVGPLATWKTRVTYFKVAVSGAQVRKHNVEIEVLQPSAEDLDHLNRKARATMLVTRTTYDAATNTFVASCDRGSLRAAVKELTVDYHTFKRAVARARELFASGGGTPPGGTGTGSSSCSKEQLARLRERLRAFLAGKDEDICGIWRDIQCCCSRGTRGQPAGDWTGSGGDLAMFAFPTVVDYQIDYSPAFAGQYGPIPFDDPWWKLLLIIIAIILTIAAAVSATADLANRSDDVVIGKVERAVLNAFKQESDIPAGLTSVSPGTVDVAVVKLNGSRGQTGAMFSYKDAASGEDNTTPIVALDGTIDTAGATLTNAEIDQLFQDLATNPTDPATQAAVQVFKSGARSGTTLALLGGFVPVMPRGPEEDGSTVFLVNQVKFVSDPATPTQISRGGDSGSLWLQRNSPRAIVALNHAGDEPETTAFGCRIEDVMTAINIHFA